VFGQSLDEFFAVRVEKFPQPRDLFGKISFFNKSVLPNRLHHLVFCESLAVVYDQEQKRFKFLRRKMNGNAVGEQSLFMRVEDEFPELIDKFLIRVFHTKSYC